MIRLTARHEDHTRAALHKARRIFDHRFRTIPAHGIDPEADLHPVRLILQLMDDHRRTSYPVYRDIFRMVAVTYQFRSSSLKWNSSMTTHANGVTSH